MKILIITPAPPTSRSGNRVTALRWARLLKQLGHRVAIRQSYSGQRCDIAIVLHARRSARSVRRIRDERPQLPLILALTGTDLYHDIHRSKSARRSLELADRLVLLQPHGRRELPAKLRRKVRVIHQSVQPPRRRPCPLKTVFEVCVIGHLRPVKDPFRLAMAVRGLPESSRIRVTHLGGALTRTMQLRAIAEMQRNPRYRWLGELPHWKTMRHLARSRLLVLTSKMEGGANVVSEAITTSVPVVSTRISGSIGLLGEDYPGYFEFGDTRGLTELLQRLETDATFYNHLSSCCRRLRYLFEPAFERETWKSVLAEFGG